MKTTNFNWTRLLRTLVALTVIVSMLLCGCVSADDNGDDNGGNSNNGSTNNGGLLGGDGDGKLETEDVVGSVTGVYGALLEMIGGKNDSLTKGGYSMDMTFTFGEDMMNNIAALLVQQGLDDDVSWFESLGIAMEVLYDETLVETNVEAKLNDTGIIRMECIVDLVNAFAYMRVPELNDEYLGAAMYMDMEMESFVQIYSQLPELMEEYGDVVEALPSEKALNTLLNRYVDIVKDAMAEPATSTEELSFGGITQSVTATTYTITRTDFLNIVEAVLVTAKSDAELEKILDEFMVWMNEKAAQEDPDWVAVDAHAEMIAAIEESLPEIEDIREGLESGEEEDLDMLTFTVYTADEKQVGFALVENNGWDTMTMYAYSLEDNGDTAFVLDVGGQFNFSGTGTTDGGKASGEYAVIVEGVEMLYLTVKDFDTKALEKGQLKGTLQLHLSEDMLYEMGLSAETVIELVMDLGGEKATMHVNLYNADGLIVGIKMVTQMLSGSIKVPGSYADMEDSTAAQDWISGMSFDQILRNLRSAGVPSELTDLLEQVIEQGMGSTGEALPDTDYVY